MCSRKWYQFLFQFDGDFSLSYLFHSFLDTWNVLGATTLSKFSNLGSDWFTIDIFVIYGTLIVFATPTPCDLVVLLQVASFVLVTALLKHLCFLQLLIFEIFKWLYILFCFGFCLLRYLTNHLLFVRWIAGIARLDRIHQTPESLLLPKQVMMVM